MGCEIMADFVGGGGEHFAGAQGRLSRAGRF